MFHRQLLFMLDTISSSADDVSVLCQICCLVTVMKLTVFGTASPWLTCSSALSGQCGCIQHHELDSDRECGMGSWIRSHLDICQCGQIRAASQIVQADPYLRSISLIAGT